MNLGDLKTSKFLKKEDVGQGILVTIKSLSQENVAKEGAEPEYKTAMHFEELDKPLILNSTNGQIIANITGKSEDIEINWVGVRIVLYNDPNITFGGKLVGGIRIRAPKKGAVVTPKQDKPQPEPSDDGLPF